MRDDKLVPAFCRALRENGQSHVDFMLHNEGLHTSAVLLFLHLKCISIKQIIVSDAAKNVIKIVYVHYAVSEILWHADDMQIFNKCLKLTCPA